MGLAKKYMKGIHDQCDFFATWPPHELRAIGDYGVLEGSAFLKLGTLQDRGIEVQTESSPAARWKYSAGATFKVGGGAGVEALAAKGAANIDFSGEGAFYFDAEECVVRSIGDLQKLAVALARQRQNEVDRWQRDWVVVQSVVLARSAVIVVSESEGSSVRIEAAAPIEASGIAKANAGLEVIVTSGAVSHFVLAGPLTPMYRLVRLNRKFWPGSEPELGQVGRGIFPESFSADTDDDIEDVSMDELLAEKG